MKQNSNLYITDLDGTLLNSEGNLSEISEKLLKNLLQRNVLFSVASSRCYSSIKEKLNFLPLTLPIIEQNGCIIRAYDSGEILKNNSINKEIAKKILSLIFQEDIAFTLSCLQNKKQYWLTYQLGGSSVFYFFGKNRFISNKIMTINSSSLNQYADGEILLFFLFGKINKLELLNKKLSTFHGVDSFIFQNELTGDNTAWLGIHSSQATKKNAILQLIKLNALPENVVVFGDQLNDMSMLAYFQRSIAVKNAHPLVQKAAKKIIGTNDDHSVARYIYHDHVLL
jgi:Cof subfamily protein (haloacid dehalogenase superfamily)